jgi:hypothetical protein
VNTYVNKMSASVNGNAFTSDKTNAAANALNGATQLTIDGTSSSGQRITIAINNFNASTGTFSINGGSGAAFGAFNTGASGSSDIIASSGQVVISTVNKTSNTDGIVYTGTFNFTASNQVVTSGTFSVFVHS